MQHQVQILIFLQFILTSSIIRFQFVFQIQFNYLQIHFKRNPNLYFELPTTKQLLLHDSKHKIVNHVEIPKINVQIAKTSICDQLLQISCKASPQSKAKNELYSKEQLYKKKQHEEELDELNYSLKFIQIRELANRRSKMLMIKWETLNNKKLFHKRLTIE
ncbi:Hypothetical_protein [Hexamita inflata]|uniref:Hypothetical_protein n=1 Tax=Hexamita inflata TaxID=28002 RepID=A0AA86TRU0_9EUKA|nr:Hypothetical protein HINF_LOCUS11927 [Hexamita inflata]